MHGHSAGSSAAIVPFDDHLPDQEFPLAQQTAGLRAKVSLHGLRVAADGDRIGADALIGEIEGVGRQPAGRSSVNEKVSAERDLPMQAE